MCAFAKRPCLREKGQRRIVDAAFSRHCVNNCVDPSVGFFATSNGACLLFGAPGDSDALSIIDRLDISVVAVGMQPCIASYRQVLAG